MTMHIHSVTHVPLPERTDIVVVTLHSMAMANWITEKCVHAGCQKTLHTISKLFIWDCLCHALDTLLIKESSLCHCIVMGEETWVNDNTRNHKMPRTWKHLSSPPTRNFMAMSTVRKIIAVFYGTKDLHDCGDSVNTEWCCGTLERVQQAFHCKRIGLLGHSIIIVTVMPGIILPTGPVSGCGINTER